ncbi:DMT family transporter [Sporosalibacterium faouarense]|uniref:DMT family transporter n=1 Tax=Sporosalibacterium faouarense TaxID=516123 RepID=UPI00141C274C|nr:EamA family transporter [Sporosalibacterium faouarense]MTI47026.1 EamA/RhaT family transporter [Bacillota bacterium]
MGNEKIMPYIAGVIYSTIFGFSFMFTKKTLDFLTPFHLLGFRFAFAAIMLTILQLIGVIKINFKGKKLHLLMLLAFFQPVTYFICETIGINMTSSSEAGMMIALIPVFVTILATVFLKETPTLRQLIFILVSVAGVVFINLMKGSTDVSGNINGIFVLLGAIVSAGFFNILSRKSSFQFKPVEITFVMMWIGTIVFNSIAIIQHIGNNNLRNYLQPLTNTSVITAILYLGILSSVIAFFMVNYMLSKIEASKSAVFANLTTIVSIFAGVVILKEDFYWFHFVGGGMILLGVWGTNYYGRMRKGKLVKD